MNIFNVNEEWRDIKGFEGLYQVSNLGRIRGLDRVVAKNRHVSGKMLVPQGPGHQTVSLWRDNKYYNKLVHRLVAEAFIPNLNNLPEVNHKDSNPLNNEVSNLEWVTSSENTKHMIANRPEGAKYRRAVRCLETHEIFPSISAASRSVSASTQQVIDSINSKSCCKGLTFVYEDNLPEDVESYLDAAHTKYQSYHKRPQMKNARKVRAIETGQEFDSIAVAARFYNCDPTTIVNRVKDHRTVEGITLEYVEEEA